MALVQQALPEWRYHSKVPHPEDSQPNVSDWGTLSVKPSTEPDPSPHWKGARVLRRWVEIPEKIDGYATRGSRVKLDLAFTSQDSITITVFANGSIVFHGDEDMQQPMLLTESAQPGQKYLIAARVDTGESLVRQTAPYLPRRRKPSGEFVVLKRRC